MTNYERYRQICIDNNLIIYQPEELTKRSCNAAFRNFKRGMISEADMYNMLHMMMTRYSKLSRLDKIEMWEIAAYLDPHAEEFHLQEYYPEEYEVHTSSQATPKTSELKKPDALKCPNKTFFELYAMIESASDMTEAERIKAYGTEGLDVLTSMFLNYFEENAEINLYFQNNAEFAGTIKVQQKKQIISLISIGYIPVPIK